ncbi:MAG: hypothetical protein MJ229_05920 [bacterium]|nr:hypothetical protein [bacterium]
MSGTEFLTLQISSGIAKEYDSLNIAYVTNELSNLKSTVDKLEDQKSDYQEVSNYLIGKDKRDTVEYRLVKDEIKSIDKKLKELADEETDLNFLKTRYENLVQEDNAEEKSFQEAADKAIKSSFTIA